MCLGMLIGTTDKHMSLLPFRIWGNGVLLEPDNWNLSGGGVKAVSSWGVGCVGG